MSLDAFLVAPPAEPELVVDTYDGPGMPPSWNGLVNQPVARHAHLLRASAQCYGDQVRISLERHRIEAYTACGARISMGGGKTKFVNLRAGKQWASTTQDEAIDQLYHRKRRQVLILEGRLTDAQQAVKAMETHLGKVPPAPRPRNYYRDYDDDYY